MTAIAPSGLSAQVESFTGCRNEIEPMFEQHWSELALDRDRVRLEVDWNKYGLLEQAGILIFVTLRQCGKLVGYYMGFLTPHLHYMGCPTLTMDIYWTWPGIRGGTAAITLMRKVHEVAKSRGAKKSVAISKNHRDSSRLFKALGYRPIETVHSKWIGE